MSVLDLRKLAAALAAKGKSSGTSGDNGGQFPGQNPGEKGEAPAELTRQVPVEPGGKALPGEKPEEKPNPFTLASKKAKERLAKGE